jgi:large subunit ribosomal protein L21
MYAILKCGGKQLKVQKGDKISIERIESKVGETITLDQIMLLADGKDVTVGTPLIGGASVTAKVLEQIRDKKVIIFKKKRRQNYRRKKGHRQYLTTIEITGINTKGGTTKVAPKKETATKETKTADKKADDKKTASTKAS